MRDGAITTHKCTRTRLLLEGGEDVKYLEGLERGRRQAILFGNVFHKVVRPDDSVAQQAPMEPLYVIAIGSGQRFTARTDSGIPISSSCRPAISRCGWSEAVRLSRRGRAFTWATAMHSNFHCQRSSSRLGVVPVAGIREGSPEDSTRESVPTPATARIKLTHYRAPRGVTPREWSHRP